MGVREALARKLVEEKLSNQTTGTKCDARKHESRSAQGTKRMSQKQEDQAVSKRIIMIVESPPSRALPWAWIALPSRTGKWFIPGLTAWAVTVGDGLALRRRKGDVRLQRLQPMRIRRICQATGSSWREGEQSGGRKASPDQFDSCRCRQYRRGECNHVANAAECALSKVYGYHICEA